MRAINYLRWSSSKQNQGSSLGRQREKYHEFCARMGWTDHAPEVLDDAVSGWSGENMEIGGLSKLLDYFDVEGGHGQVMVVENMDRASRLEVSTVLRFVFRLTDTGASLALIDNAMVIDKNSIRNQVEQIKLLVEEANRSRSEGDRKSALSRAGWSEIRLGKDVIAEFGGEITDIVRHPYGIDITISSKRRTSLHEVCDLVDGFDPKIGDYVEAGQPIGWLVRKTHTGNTCPAWLRLTDCRRSFYVREDRAEVLREIYEWRADGQSYNAICRKLNMRGTETFRGGAGWQSSAVKALIGNRAMIGEYQHKSRATGEIIGEPVPDYFPRIMSNELFQRATDLRLTHAMAGRGKEVMHRNLLADLARCGWCGSKMRFNRKTRRGAADETYFQCSNYDRRQGCTHRKMYRGEPIAAAILDRVLHLAMDDQLFQNDDKVRAANTKLADLREQLGVIGKRLDRIIDEIEIEDTPSDRLRARRRALEADEAKMKAEIAAEERALQMARGAVEPAEHIRRVGEIRGDIADHGDAGLKARALVKMSLNDLIERLEFTRGGAIMIRLTAGLQTLYIRPDGNGWTFDAIDAGSEVKPANDDQRQVVDAYKRRKEVTQSSGTPHTRSTGRYYSHPRTMRADDGRTG